VGNIATSTPSSFSFGRDEEASSATGQVRGFFSMRYLGMTEVAPDIRDLDALRNGPIVLGEEAAEQFRAVLEAGRTPLPALSAERLIPTQPL
jgi:hypothetical protein